MTYKQAKTAILEYPESSRWTVHKYKGYTAQLLKVPYAVSPEKNIVVWFKAQAVYGHTMHPWHGKPDFKAARSLHIPDLRKLDGPEFVKWVRHWFRNDLL